MTKDHKPDASIDWQIGDDGWMTSRRITDDAQPRPEHVAETIAAMQRAIMKNPLYNDKFGGNPVAAFGLANSAFNALAAQPPAAPVGLDVLRQMVQRQRDIPGMPPQQTGRPSGSNADEWNCFLSEHLNSTSFLAVQIAEAIEDGEKRGSLSRSSAETGDSGVRSALALRLRDAAQTAQNDDLSKPNTEKRQRHVIRVEAMLDAAEYLEEVIPAAPQTVSHSVALAQFVKWALQEGAWDGADLNGASIQDKAEELGLIVKTKYDPAVHGDHDYCPEPGDDWYVLAPGVASLALSRPQSQSDNSTQEK